MEHRWQGMCVSMTTAVATTAMLRAYHSRLTAAY